MRAALPTLYVGGPLFDDPAGNARISIAFGVELIKRGWAETRHGRVAMDGW